MAVIESNLCAVLFLLASPLLAEQGTLVVHVKDLSDHPVSGVRFRAGDSSISPPSAQGEARLRLAAQTKPGDVVMLEIVSAPKDLVMISPWDKWVHLPPFDNAAKNFIPVVVAERGDKLCLENPGCIRAAAAQINKANAPQGVAEKRDSETERKEALTTVAKGFRLPPEEIDKAIRAWGQRTEDPFEKGLATLYEKRYPEASEQLAKSFEMHKTSEARSGKRRRTLHCFLGSLFTSRASTARLRRHFARR